ncbi:TlpA disulfide reductase family protein [Nocardioides sp. SOB77]|uniref:TlpA disulfide reductase family protein n=1 Tax=Nocardioides oceani TaxID=3058369 RepID=A0ABT8FMF8_9ACTN|nr:TlpA disulfide reductase family protein [Nocardioides oceani]MDN4175700.1 TlpA disulfide reductase family protein [Nocardioides oceani]
MSSRTGAWARRTAGLAVLVVALTACTADRGGPTATDGVVEVIADEDRAPVKPIKGELLDGKRFDSSALAGQVVVYNVWGSWCAPCRTEAPTLKQVSEESESLGVRFVGINVRDNDAAARAFEDSYGIEYPSITTGTSGQALLAFGAALPPSAVPSTMVVDTQGRLAARIIGPADYTTLSTLVSDVVEEQEPSDD